jgi:hypothetical protein
MWINPPEAIGIRHLHVHVQPPAAIVIQNEQEFYMLMTRHLADRLSKLGSTDAPRLREATGAADGR